MKKTMLLLVFALGFIGLNAQENSKKVSMGIKAEANTAFFLLNDLDNAGSKVKLGGNVGVFTKIMLNEHLAIQPELMLTLRNSELKLAGVKNDYQYFGAEIPVYCVGQWNWGRGKFMIGAGPYVGVGFNAKFKNGNIDLFDNNTNVEMNRWDIGAGLTMGYEFRNGLQINLGHKFGLLNVLNNGQGDESIHNQVLSVGLGFRF